MELYDDAANYWGCNLVQSNQTSRRRTQNVRVGETDPSRTPLEHIVRQHCAPFRLVHISPHGSDANAFGISALSNNRVDSVLFASGLYVSGNDIHDIRNYSTSCFSIKDGLSYPSIPIGLTNGQAVEFRQQILPLPYFISVPTLPPSLSLTVREMDILAEVEVRCFLSQMAGQPIKVLMLELILAGCGGTLSLLFLEELARLSTKHDFVFLVDEIMTGARTGTVLYTTQMPKVFIDRVACITLGKWCHHGMVLWHSDHTDLLPDFSRSRGTSTNISYDTALHLWERMIEVVDKSTARRSALLKKIRCPEHLAWGVGCLVFCHRRRTGPGQALKNRYLPSLESLPWAPLSTQKELFLTTQYVNQKLDASADAWMAYSHQYIGAQSDRSILAYLMEAGRVDHLNKEHYNKHEFQTAVNDWSGLRQRAPVSWQEAKRALSLLEKAGHCSLVCKFKRRKKGIQFSCTSYLHFD